MATKTFPYSVIWEGKIIPANTPIEVKDKKPEADEVKDEKPKKRGAK